MSASPTVARIVYPDRTDNLEVLFAKTKDGFFQYAWREEESDKFHIRYFPSGKAPYQYIEVVSEHREEEDQENSTSPTIVTFVYDAGRLDKFTVKYAKTRDGFFQMAVPTADGKFTIRYYPNGETQYTYIEVTSEKKHEQRKRY